MDGQNGRNEDQAIQQDNNKPGTPGQTGGESETHRPSDADEGSSGHINEKEDDEKEDDDDEDEDEDEEDENEGEQKQGE